MRFFQTLREKRFVTKSLQRGDVLPFIKYLLYRVRLSSLFLASRPLYRIPVWHTPYALWLWNHPTTPKIEELFFAAYVKQGDTVIDCGAHIGTLSTIAHSLVGKEGVVYSCEAHPRTAAYCRGTLTANGFSSSNVHNVAISDNDGTAHMTDLYVSDMNTLDEEGSITVTTRSLDSLFGHLEKVSLLKLDIEGEELAALKGGRELLKKTEVVFCESAPRRFGERGYELKEILELLHSQGFALGRTYLQDGELRVEHIDTSYRTKEKYDNIVGYKDKEAFYSRLQ